MVKRTYIDASVLIAAFRGDENASRQVMIVLDDPERKLVVSDFLRLEVLPQPMFNKRREEIDFMQSILDSAAEDVPSSSNITKQALELAARYDMAPMDSLHVGAAVIARVDELITLEKQTKPMFRVKEIRVISLHSS